MKNIALVGLSVFTMLISCKCKKATTEVAAAKETTTEEVKNVKSNLITNLSENSSPKQEVSATNNNMKSQEQSAVVEYEANTRGYFLKIKYSNGKLEYTNERGSEILQSVSLTKSQIEELNQLLNSFKEASLPELKDPTQKRFYDGAAIANLKITNNGKEYKTVDFDHGFPPATIEKFVKKLVSYTKQN